MNLLVKLADGPGQEQAVNHLLAWLVYHGFDSYGEIVTIGKPGQQPVFAWRITGVTRMES